jgi:hypothetical protein
LGDEQNDAMSVDPIADYIEDYWNESVSEAARAGHGKVVRHSIRCADRLLDALEEGC